MVQHIWCDWGECDIQAPQIIHKLTLGSGIHESVKFAQDSYESAQILSCHVYLLHILDIEQFAL